MHRKWPIESLNGRIKVSSNVDKLHAVSVNSMQSKLPNPAIKALTLNDFMPQLPPPQASIEQGEARMQFLFSRK